MIRAEWIREIPEVGRNLRLTADILETTKAELRRQLEVALRDEAKLWAEMRSTGKWTRQEMAAALVKMDPAVLPYLPDR